jgi:type II protein arginine methyltransferase
MLNDRNRNRAFADAIGTLPLAGATILDIGAGSGLLSILAVRAGAQQVYACEGIPIVAHTASQIIALHQLGELIRIIPKYSFNLEIGSDLPQRADVLITETVDCGLVGEGLLSIVRHAKKELLREHAKIVPMRASLYAALLESEDIHALNYATDAAGVDVSLFNRFSTKGYFPVRAETWPHRLLGDGAEVFAFDLATDSLDDCETIVTLSAERGDTVHGVMLWFDLELQPGIFITNRPYAGRSHWMQAVQCFERPIRIHDQPGLQVVIRLSGTAIHVAPVLELRGA